MKLRSYRGNKWNKNWAVSLRGKLKTPTFSPGTRDSSLRSLQSTDTSEGFHGFCGKGEQGKGKKSRDAGGLMPFFGDFSKLTN